MAFNGPGMTKHKERIDATLEAFGETIKILNKQRLQFTFELGEATPRFGGTAQGLISTMPGIEEPLVAARESWKAVNKACDGLGLKASVHSWNWKNDVDVLRTQAHSAIEAKENTVTAKIQVDANNDAMRHLKAIPSYWQEVGRSGLDNWISTRERNGDDAVTKRTNKEARKVFWEHKDEILSALEQARSIAEHSRFIDEKELKSATTAVGKAHKGLCTMINSLKQHNAI